MFETLNARPPGALRTLGLLAVHGGSFLLALVLLVDRACAGPHGLGRCSPRRITSFLTPVGAVIDDGRRVTCLRSVRPDQECRTDCLLEPCASEIASGVKLADASRSGLRGGRGSVVGESG